MIQQIPVTYINTDAGKTFVSAFIAESWDADCKNPPLTKFIVTAFFHNQALEISTSQKSIIAQVYE